MNTCKTALRILKSRKMYLVIYLGFIGIMMFAISWQIMRGSMTGGDEVFHPDTARVAGIDRWRCRWYFIRAAFLSCVGWRDGGPCRRFRGVAAGRRFELC